MSFRRLPALASNRSPTCGEQIEQFSTARSVDSHDELEQLQRHGLWGVRHFHRITNLCGANPCPHVPPAEHRLRDISGQRFDRSAAE